MLHDEQLVDVDTEETLEEVIQHRRSELRRSARPVGERLFAESPDQLVGRIGEYWDATREYAD